MKKSRIIKGAVLTLAMTLMLIGGSGKAYAGATCCERTSLTTTLVSTYYTYSNHQYGCSIHGVVEYCTAKTTHNVYNKSCRNCGSDWGNSERTSVSHSKCQ